MNYNSGSSHLLSYIIQEATGMSTERFAKKYLFNPLEINEYEWQQRSAGYICRRLRYENEIYRFIKIRKIMFAKWILG